MDALRILEEKIVSLVAVVQDLKAKNEALKAEVSKEIAARSKLESEREKLAEENADLAAKISMMENSVLKGNERIEETKVVVDDLIRSIDALVGNEHQQ
jgi:FtsZ-binding cell division protein ZapB